MVKSTNIRKQSQIIQMDTNCHYNVPVKRAIEGGSAEKRRWCEEQTKATECSFKKKNGSR